MARATLAAMALALLATSCTTILGPAPPPTPRPGWTVAPTLAPLPTLPTTGIQSIEPAGEWVTSSHPTARLYYHRSDPRWSRLEPHNLWWFDTVVDLQAQFPGRRPAE